MTRRAVSSAALCFFFLALLACLPELAHADTIDFYTGDFGVYGGVSYYPGGGTAGTDTVYNSLALNFEFQFNGDVTNFQEPHYCGLGCPQFYSGNIDSGTVQFSGIDESGQNPSYNFTGIIDPGGTLTGEIVCDNQGCAWQNQIEFSFESTSGTNGWRSSGELSWMDGNDGSGGSGFGSLNLLTQQASTPEPSSFLVRLRHSGLGEALRRRRRL